MIEQAISFTAVLLVFISLQMGVKAGPSAALSWMLAAFFSLLVAMRYWFIVSHWAISYQAASLPLIAILVFWLMFLIGMFVFLKLSETCIDKFAPVYPSILGRILGGLLGLLTGVLIISALMMSLSIAAPKFLPGYNPARLPLAIDRVPEDGFRLIEATVIGVNAKDPAHTFLPRFEQAGSEDPSKFWQ